MAGAARIAIDSQLLVYAFREDSPWHENAAGAFVELAESGRAWAIPWPCVHEFLCVVTRPGLYDPPASIATAFKALDGSAGSGTLSYLAEGFTHLERLRELCISNKLRGPHVHDAKIAAICIENGVHELWTANTGFSRFRQLRSVNPLMDRSS